jgi:hypothetical protein
MLIGVPNAKGVPPNRRYFLGKPIGALSGSSKNKKEQCVQRDG